jgi:inorganic pyrophosphatase
MANVRKYSPYTKLVGVDGSRKRVNVVIETPRGCRNKYKFDSGLSLFRLSSVLPAGAVFPFDFGYVPGTTGDDGDPLDVLLLIDEPVFPGCVVPARLIGVIEAEQREHGTTMRNDRLLAVACDSREHHSIRSIKDLDENLVCQIEHFFSSYNAIKGRRFTILGRRGRHAAAKAVRKAMNAH